MGASWFLYVLLCKKDNSLYTGISTNVGRRLRQHQGEIAGGAKYTASRRPVRLLVAWRYNSRSQAARAEHRFKQLSRHEKLHFINNPELWAPSWETYGSSRP